MNEDLNQQVAKSLGHLETVPVINYAASGEIALRLYESNGVEMHKFSDGHHVTMRYAGRERTGVDEDIVVAIYKGWIAVKSGEAVEHE